MSDGSSSSRSKPCSVSCSSSSGGLLVCWGCGVHGQHCHGRSAGDVHSRDGLVKNFGCCATGDDEADVTTERLGVVSVACGSSHTIALTENNEVYSWGNGSNGQLGTGDREVRWQPTRVDVFSGTEGVLPYQRISGVCCGGWQTFVWFENGQAGCLGHCQAGSGDTLPPMFTSRTNAAQKQAASHIPRFHLFEIPSVKLVSCGENHSIFLFQDGTLGACGLNSAGQLGTGDRASSQSVRMLDAVSDIRTVACGAEHSLALSESGKLLVWGYGKAIGFEEGDALEPTERVHHNTNIVMIAGGRSHCVVLTENGNVYTWGNGVEGQLGHGEHVTYACVPRKVEHGQLQSSAVQVAAGDLYSAAITRDGHLFMWGKNSHVIDADRDPSERSFVPQVVCTATGRVNFIACGAWHAACIASDTGAESARTHSILHMNQVVDCDVDDAVVLSKKMDHDGLLTKVDLGLKTSDDAQLSKISTPDNFDMHITQLLYETHRDDMLAADGTASAVGAVTWAESRSPPRIDEFHATSREQHPVITEQQPAVALSAASRFHRRPVIEEFQRSEDSWAPDGHLAVNRAEPTKVLSLPILRARQQSLARKPASDVTAAAVPPLLRSEAMAGTIDASSAISLTTSVRPGQLGRTSSDMPDRPRRHAMHTGLGGQAAASDSRSHLTSGSVVVTAGNTAVSLAAAADSTTDSPHDRDPLLMKSSSQTLAKATALRALPTPHQMSLHVQLKQHRETPEEKTLREMRARHEELFMKEKALRRQLLPRGALQRLPLATQGSSVTPKVQKEYRIGEDSADGGRDRTNDTRLAGARATSPGRPSVTNSQSLTGSGFPNVAASSTRFAVALQFTLANGVAEKAAPFTSLQSALHSSSWNQHLPYLSRNS